MIRNICYIGIFTLDQGTEFSMGEF